MKEAIHRIFNNKIDATGLAVFRMCYALVLTCELVQLFRFRHILYDDIPFVYAGEMYGGIVIAFNIVATILIFFGLFTRVATLFNYVLGIVVFSSMVHFEYHVHYAYVGINFLMLFMPVSRVMSLDSLFEKIKYTNIGRPYRIDRNVLALNYIVPVFVGVGLVYFDSIFRKLDSPMWREGLGMWLPSSMPMAVWNDTSIVLNHEFLVRFLGYLVLVFESIFIFTFWFKRFRIPFLFLGMFFHFGILVTYPIPWFALAIMVVYLLMVPQSWWIRLSAFFKSKKQTYTFYYDAECPLCNKVVVAVRHFDVFNKITCATVQGNENNPALAGIPEEQLLINIHGVDQNGKVYVGYDAYVALMKNMIYPYAHALVLQIRGISWIGRKAYAYIAGHRLTERCTSENCMLPVLSEPMREDEDFLVHGWNRLALSKKFWKIAMVAMFVMQAIIISLCPLFEGSLRGTLFGKAMQKTYSVLGMPAKKAFGITSHPVFMDGHFGNYNHIFKIVCNENGKIVPLLDDNGMVTNSYATGAFWVNHTFRVNSTTMYQSQYEIGVERYLRQFQNDNGLASASYSVYCKILDSPKHWKYDFLHDQIKKPWVPAGKISVSPRGSSFSWTPEMTAIFETEAKVHHDMSR